MSRTSLRIFTFVCGAAVPLVMLSAGTAPAFADDPVLPPGPGVEVGPDVEIGPAVDVGPAYEAFLDDIVGMISEGSDLAPPRG